jgi:clan AA aspartic protease (TIGR02281 family)
MKKIFLNYILFYSLLSLLVFNPVFAQTTIKMQKENGVYLIPCKVNGLNLKFIFDTGASDVSISLSEALFMLKNDYMDKSDLIGSEYYQIANGNIAEGTKIIIRKIEIGSKILYNVEASIVHTLDAPLLLGQSAIEKLGKFSFDYATNTLTFGTSISNTNFSNTNSISSNSTILNFNNVKIGSQIWMTENLNVERFRNGDIIPEVKSNEEWLEAGYQGKPAWCYYENNPENGKKYGKLYNWYAISDSRGLIPNGWHISSDDEWTILIDYLGGEDSSESRLKSKYGWQEKRTITNECGFSGLPGGNRSANGPFNFIDTSGYWWSSYKNNKDEGRIHILDCCGIKRYYYASKAYGFSIRCIKN